MGLRLLRPAARVWPWFQAVLVCFAVPFALGCAGKGGSTSGSGGTNALGSGGTANAGSTGASGAIGSAGSGSAGTSGATGSAGATGFAGTSGSAGASGRGGTTGGGGTTGSAGDSGSAGTTGSAAATGTDAGTDTACQMAEINWSPKIPTAFLLVDRGGSSFDTMVPGPNGTNIPVFTALKNAVEQLLPPLDGQVRFGFGAFTGNFQSSPQMCPIFDQVPTGINNAAAIKTKYDSLDSTGKPQFKPETPVIEVLPTVESALLNDSGNGQKYILFISNGLVDFCDDQSDISHCAADAVTAKFQDYYAEGIQTLIIALPSMYGPMFFSQVLQTFANAGVGQPAAIPNASGGPAPAATPAAVYSECNNLSSSGPVQYAWRDYYTKEGRTGMTSIASYADQGGSAQVYAPSSMDQSGLLNAISQALQNVKSCTFDLSDVGGKSIKVDTTKLDQATVKIMGATIQLDPTNGWSVSAANPTQLALNGNACATWRMPASTQIDLNFPCSSIIFE